MVKKTVIPVINNSKEEIISQDVEILNVEETYTVEENIIKLEDDTTRETDEIKTHEKLEDKPKPKGKHKMLNDMPTIENVIAQVQCQACNKSMSAKNFKNIIMRLFVLKEFKKLINQKQYQYQRKLYLT